MSLTLIFIIAAAIMGVLVIRTFRGQKACKEYERLINGSPSQCSGWIELADSRFQPIMFGKVLYNYDKKVVGVGVLVKENLPPLLDSDIDEKIAPQLLDDHWPLCRFLIDFGDDVIISELKDIKLHEKLMPYVAEHSKIKLMIGLNSNEFFLVDNKEAERNFERIWQETKAQKPLQSQ
ncbi:MAG: hypothetical protein LLF94_08180 [Chlamydiales bacterium]|nr:hypothetical protein [Chlamydiales bacterium]